MQYFIDSLASSTTTQLNPTTTGEWAGTQIFTERMLMNISTQTVFYAFCCFYFGLADRSSNENTFTFSLTGTSPIICPDYFCSDSYHFIAPVLISVRTTGIYKLSTQSNMDTYGYLYQPMFDVRFIYLNLIDEDDDSFGDGQFEIENTFQANQSYVVVVSTYNPYEMGIFTAVGTGPDLLNFTLLTNLSKFFVHLY